MKRSGNLLPVSVVAAVVVTLSAVLAAPVGAHPDGPSHHSPLPVHATAVMRAFAADAQAQSTAPAVTGGAVTCSQDGQAAGYPCQNVDLLSYLPLDQIGGTRSNSAANDIWGWTDPASGKEYAIIGRVFGTSFVDISAPESPVYLGELPTHGAFGSSWRDIKVYKDHAFIVSEAMGHGMQVFDLRQLRNVTGPPVTFAETAHYNKVATSHNVAINEDTGFAYVIGAAGKNSCSGGLHMVDIRTPASPSFAGCFSADGYTHDTQCVVYTGPDATYHGREICLNSNEDTVTIVDVTTKSAPVMLSRTSYAGSAYTHQGWLTEDQQHFLVDDELDEQNFGHGTRTRVFDVSDLDNPAITGSYDSTSTAIDHNQYVKGNYSFQANYRSGLRILQIDTTATAPLSQVGYFDIYPADDAAEFNGAWSNYPYFASGVVIVSGIEQGLFVLRPNLPSGGGTDAPPTVTVKSPTDGATVSGSTTVAADATDDKAVAQVSFRVDGASIGSDSDGSDGWSVSWDTTSTKNGAHNLTATATDTAGQKASHTVSVTVDNPTMHVGDLDGTSSAAKGGKWNATVTVLVQSSNEIALADATVSGTWSGGASGTASCTTTTGSVGTCSVTLASIARTSTTVTFTVSGVAHPAHTYAADANHDAEPDSDGTTIVVAKP